MNKVKRFIKELDASKYTGSCIGMLLILIGAFLISRFLTMNDAYWHIKCGEYIADTFPKITLYDAWAASDSKWVAHEWLFDIIVYNLSSISMNVLVLSFVLVYIVMLALMLTESGLFKKSDDTPIIYTCIVVGTQITLMALATAARPQSYSNLLLVLLIIILNKSLDKPKLSLTTVPLTVLWVNIHGGTTNIIYFITFVYLVCNSINFRIGKIKFTRASNNWIVTVAITIVLQLLAICVNPFGAEMLVYPYSNMKDKIMTAIITEWVAPDAKDIGIFLLMIMPMILGIVSLIQTDKDIRSVDVALYFMMIILFMRSIRFCIYLSIIQTMLIYKYGFTLNIINLSKVKNNKLKIADNISLIISWVTCTLLITAILLFTDYSRIDGNDDISNEMLEVIKEDNPERLLNHYEAGGYLLYNGIDTFIDGRYEPFKQLGIVDEYYNIYHKHDIKTKEHIDEMFNKYDFDACLLKPSNAMLYEYLVSTNEFKMMFSDDKYMYFSKIK